MDSGTESNCGRNEFFNSLLGGLFLIGGIFSYIQVQSFRSRIGAPIGHSDSFMYTITYSEFLMGIVAIGAAIFIHVRAKKIVLEYLSHS
jgi:hypothetical protein